ncbi:hypothetical protein VPH35_113603 [Triticum aestivum]
MSTKITVTYKRKRGTSRAQQADDATPEPPPVSSSGVAGSEATKDQADADARSSRVLPRFNKSANITRTHKRKGGTSLAQTTDRATSELPTISSGGLAYSEALEDGTDNDNDMFNGSNLQQDACKPKQESAIEETAKLCAHASKKEQKEIPLCEPLPRTKRPGICSLPVAEVWNDKLHCTNDVVNPIPASSSVWDLRHANGTTNQAKDSNNSAHAAINSHEGPEDTSRRNQCKNRFSPQLTFRRRVKRKINLDKPAERNYTNDNGKEYSTLACNPQSLPINATPLLKVTDADILDTADKVAKEGTSTGLSVSAQRFLDEKSSHMRKSTVQHTVSTRHIEDARAEDWSKTLGRVVEAAEAVEMKKLHDDPPESQGSTKHIPIIVLDYVNDERARGKLPENSKVVQEENKSRFNLGKINLNPVELPQERLLGLDDSSFQRLPDQDHFVTGQKQVSQPIERLFFTKEKDVVHGKEQHQEGTPALHTLNSNLYGPTPSRKSGSSKEPKSMPSELKFRIMDNAPESSLERRLDSFQYSGKSSGIDLLTERISTYSYKRHQVPWSEEELDFLWIGVRRYGTSNWNAMLRDTRLRFSSSRMSEDLSEQWGKEQKKLLLLDLQSIRTSALGSERTHHIAEGYAGSSKSPFLAAQSDLPLGEVHLQNAHALDRGQHYLSSLGRFNLHELNNVPRNLSLGGFPGVSSSQGRTGSRRRKTTKLQKSNGCQELPERTSSQLLPINQQPINSLPKWLTKGVDTGKSWLNPAMRSSASQASGQSTADPLKDDTDASSEETVVVSDLC